MLILNSETQPEEGFTMRDICVIYNEGYLQIHFYLQQKIFTNKQLFTIKDFLHFSSTVFPSAVAQKNPGVPKLFFF